MRKFFAIWSRELSGCFLSPVAYVTMVVFLAVTGGTFMALVQRNAGLDQSVVAMLFSAIVAWLPVLVTVISMRLFTEEKRSGTLETLMTAPVTEAVVVLGKFLGALLFLVAVCAPAIGYVFVLEYLSPGISMQDIDLGALLGGCLVLLLISSLTMAIGLLVSLTTKNQIIAAMCSFCAVWLVLVLGELVTKLPMRLKALGEYLSCVHHVDRFSAGIIDVRPIVLFVSATAFVLFTAVRVLEMRRWK